MTPALFFPCSLLLLVTAGAAGIAIRRRYPALISEDHSGQFTAMQAAVLALLGLLVGFTFAMATNRFTERRLAELEEERAELARFQAADAQRRSLEYTIYDKEAAETRAKLEQARRPLSFHLSGEGRNRDVRSVA